MDDASGQQAPSGGDKPGRRFQATLTSLLINLVILSASVLLTLAVAEIAVRLARPQQLVLIRPDLWMGVDTLGWQRRPNVDLRVNKGEGLVRVITDDEGFRVGSGGRRVESDSILLIGDSFMEALQVEYEESLAGLIEGSLTGPHGQRVAVRNAAVGGWDSPHYRILAERRLRANSYGLLLVSVLVGNDVVSRAPEYFPPRPPAERGRFSVPLSLSRSAWIDGLVLPLNNFLEVRSHLFVLAKNATAPLRIRLGMSAAYMPRGVLRENAHGEEWGLTADVLADIAKLARRQGTPTLFVLIPERYQVDMDLFQAHASAYGLEGAEVDLAQPNRRLVEELSARNLEVIDALPAFQEQQEAGGPSLYGSVDPHLSAHGHEALFRLLSPRLSELLWRN